MSRSSLTPLPAEVSRPAANRELRIPMPKPNFVTRFTEGRRVSDSVSELRVKAAVDIYEQVLDVEVTRATQHAELVKANDFINHESAMNKQREGFLTSTTSALEGVNHAATSGASRLLRQGKALMEEVENSGGTDSERAFLQERIAMRMRRSFEILDDVETKMSESIAKGADQSFAKRSS